MERRGRQIQEDIKVLVIKKPLVSKKRKECDNYEALPEVELRTGLGAFVACRSESRYLKV